MKLAKLGSIAALCAAPLIANAQGIELKLGHVGAPGSLIGAAADEFAKNANAKLAGKVKIVVYGSSQLGGDKEMLQKLKLGTVDMVEPSTVMGSVSDIYGVFEMPYLVKDRKHMQRIEKELYWSKFEPELAKKGYKTLAVWENGYRHITNNKHPIKTPADLAGIKLRVPNSKWRVNMFKAYGANPSPMKFSEVFTALQTGVMDGQENPFAQIASGKFYEVQKYLSITGHVYSPAYLIVSSKHFAKLPADVQKVLAQTAKETQAFVYEKAVNDEKKLLEQMKKAGIAVNYADKDAFIAASKPIYDEFSNEVPLGKEVIERAIALGK